MKQTPEKFKPVQAEAPDLATLELKANLNSEQREYLEVLKDKMRKILGNKTKQELAKAGDLVTLKKYKAILTEILVFLRTKEIKKEIDSENELVFSKPDGTERRIEISQQLKYWTDFYDKLGIDWVKLPEELKLSESDRENLVKGAKSLCPEGDYENLKMLIIPENIVTDEATLNKFADRIHRDFIDFMFSARYSDWIASSNRMRVILVRDAKEIVDDREYKKTLGLSVTDLTNPGALFDQISLRGIDAFTYLIWQKEYHINTGQYLDEHSKIWLTEQLQFNHGHYAYFSEGELFFKKRATFLKDSKLGCRLAYTVEV